MSLFVLICRIKKWLLAWLGGADVARHLPWGGHVRALRAPEWRGTCPGEADAAQDDGEGAVVTPANCQRV